MAFNYRSIGELSDVIRVNIPQLQEGRYDLIVGIPRSGMLPASMIALHLNLPLMTLEEWRGDDVVRHGITRRIGSAIRNAAQASRVLVVDDSLDSGQSVIKVKEQLSEELLAKACFLAIYASKPTYLVDIYFEVVARPRVFEWNIMHSAALKNACVDIDGVLCCDPKREDNDDGSRYLTFIQSAQLKFKPTEPVKLLVTNRLEKYREATENWLHQQGIQYEKLVMLDLPDKQARLDQEDYFAHKVRAFKESECPLFIESDYRQAVEISNRCHKSVYCVDRNQMVFAGSRAVESIKNRDWKQRLTQRWELRIRHYLMPYPAAFRTTKRLYRLLFGR